ncbi:MAG: DUF177 domain-containing protein [Clostridia bacterium]|nr:DUF177 domain-containing protein [Clostridia bacterium]
MIVALESIFDNGISNIPLDFSFDFSDVEFDGAFPFTTPVTLKGCIKNETDIVYIDAVAGVDYDGQCDRCAAAIHRHYTVPVNHVLVADLNNEDNDEYILVEGMRLDIYQLTLEDVCLFLPSKLLCREDCKGICFQCGKNLNEGVCGCSAPVDPRLAALQQLLDN